MKGKRVIITGGGSGYGAGIAAALVKAGAKVWITGRDAAKRERTAAEIGATPIAADVTRGADWDRVFAAVGEVDVLVNNAGAGVKIAEIAEQSDAEIAESISVNLTGAIMGCARAAKLMKARGKGGAIVNISSVVGITGNAGQANYTASKGGVIALTKTTAKELGSRNVRCNAIAPGFIESKMTEGLSEEIKKSCMDSIPLRRFGKVEDVARAVAWLVSDDASYITGQVLGVNGGMI